MAEFGFELVLVAQRLILFIPQQAVDVFFVDKIGQLFLPEVISPIGEVRKQVEHLHKILEFVLVGGDQGQAMYHLLLREVVLYPYDIILWVELFVEFVYVFLILLYSHLSVHTDLSQKLQVIRSHAAHLVLEEIYEVCDQIHRLGYDFVVLPELYPFFLSLTLLDFDQWF